MKIIAYIAMSLDGYIATKDDKVDWLGGDGSDPENMGSYPAFFESIDTVILGYSTYNQIITVLSPHEWPYKNKQSYVFTHRACEDTDEISFINESAEALAMRLKENKKDRVWLCGGAHIIAQFHEKGLIDEYHVSVIPTLLGNGIRLFSETNYHTKLKLKSSVHYNGIVDIVYEKRES